jgi:hypothetical protein
LAYATKFYTDLFGPAPEFDIHLNDNIWDGAACLSDVRQRATLQNHFLSQRFGMHYPKWKKTKQPALIISPLNFIKHADILLRRI